MSAAVVGLPHPHWTEAVTAFVVKQENADLDEQDVIDLCKRELGKFEIPKRVVFIDEMPLTSTGKIRKNILRENNTEVYQS